jgi:hypothetical protein
VTEPDRPTEDPDAKPSSQAASGVGLQTACSGILCSVLILGVSILLGLVSHSIGLGHPRGRLFQILIALPLAGLGIIPVRYNLVSRKFTMALVILGAVVAVGSIHYFEYRQFPERVGESVRLIYQAQVLLARVNDEIQNTDELIQQAVQVQSQSPKKAKPLLEKLTNLRVTLEQQKEDLEKKLAAVMSKPEREQQLEPLLRRLEQELAAERAQESGHRLENQSDPGPAVDRWLENLGFWTYLDLRAEQGVPFEFFGTTVRLGYVASYFWWVAKIVLAALITGFLFRKVVKHFARAA